jgi:hypothetical protein
MPSPKQWGEDIKMSMPKAPEKETGEMEELATTQAATQLSPPHNKMAIDPTPRAPSPMSDASSNIRAKGTGKKLPQMFVRSDMDDDDISACGYESLEEDDGPAQPFKYVGPPTEYRLDRTTFHRMTVHRHVCVKSPTHWDTDVKSLYDKWDKSVKKYVWNTGFPSQMAREASKIPFDQRSYAQQWAVANATRLLYLPLGDTQVEPNVEAIAIMNGFHKAVRCDEDVLLNVKDITTWLLLKMAEPEEQDVVDWFWWHSCKLFTNWTLYAEMLKNLGCKVEDHLTPK